MNRPAATEESPCNLCGAADYEVVGRTDRDGRPLRTVMCRRCGLVWVNPRPPAAEMNAYYATAYRADYKGAAAPPLRKIVRGMLGARERSEMIRSLLPTRSAAAEGRPTLTDVGCGAGELVYLLRRQGIDASGLEPGQEYAEFARQVLAVPIQTATVDRAAVAAGSQDVVTMFHALEHVPDPRGVLATVRAWVRQGGLVVVEVPNVESVVQAPSHRFHYAHLYHFSRTTLEALGEAAGLRVVRTTFSEDGGNVTVVFRRESEEVRRPGDLAAHTARTREILRAHTTMRHYLSATPYRRVLARGARRLREDLLLRRLKSVQDVLRWADRAF